VRRTNFEVARRKRAEGSPLPRPHVLPVAPVLAARRDVGAGEAGPVTGSQERIRLRFDGTDRDTTFSRCSGVVLLWAGHRSPCRTSKFFFPQHRCLQAVSGSAISDGFSLLHGNKKNPDVWQIVAVQQHDTLDRWTGPGSAVNDAGRAIRWNPPCGRSLAGRGPGSPPARARPLATHCGRWLLTDDRAARHRRDGCAGVPPRPGTPSLGALPQRQGPGRRIQPDDSSISSLAVR
jgi:hypothetical protein